MVHPFLSLFANAERRILGLMSGTSLDGIDVADVSISGSGPNLSWKLNGFASLPYSNGLKEILLRNSSDETASLAQITVLEDVVAKEHERAIRSAISDWGLGISDFDVIGTHGQTIFHQPENLPLGEFNGRGTLQIGDPSILAQRLGIPVVGDFRVADMALGGQGAPLVPYFDFVTFASTDASRLLINVGGIANITVIPAGGGLDDVQAFDTGPGNMLLDAAARRYLSREYDEGGSVAATGTVSHELLAELLSEPWFDTKPPRSTGRELFSIRYAQSIFDRAEMADLATADLMATLSAFTVSSIVDSWERFIRADVQVDAVLVSGGGVYNRTIMDGLSNEFNGIPVSSTAESGVDPDAKESVCFAVLAHETLNGVPTGVPGATGAARAALLGKICLPTPVQNNIG